MHTCLFAALHDKTEQVNGGGTHCGAACSLLQLLGIGRFWVVGDDVGPFAGQGGNVISSGGIQLSLEATQVQLAPIQPQTGLPPLSQPARSRMHSLLAVSELAGLPLWHTLAGSECLQHQSPQSVCDGANVSPSSWGRHHCSSARHRLLPHLFLKMGALHL